MPPQPPVDAPVEEDVQDRKQRPYGDAPAGIDVGAAVRHGVGFDLQAPMAGMVPVGYAPLSGGA